MSHPAAFLATLAAAGIAPSDPAAIVADGQLHRFHIDGDKPGRRNGWAVLHLDGLAAGAFGSWKHGIAGSWCAKDRASLSPAERADHRRRIARAREQAQAARTRAQAAAAARAARLWAQARPADVLHPYRVQKAVPLFSARQLGARLVLPVADFAGRLHSLQFIDGAGGKKLLKDGRKRGHFIRVAGRMPPAARVLICEGWATGATLATLEPAALVLAAIDAGNLGRLPWAPASTGQQRRSSSAPMPIRSALPRPAPPLSPPPHWWPSPPFPPGRRARTSTTWPTWPGVRHERAPASAHAARYRRRLAGAGAAR